MIARATLIALCAVLAPSRASAQWRVEVTDCDGVAAVREGLVRALEIELDGPIDPDAAAGIRIALGCAVESAIVTVVDDARQVRVERRVMLETTPEHLRERLLALVARELTAAARRIAEDTEPRATGSDVLGEPAGAEPERDEPERDDPTPSEPARVAPDPPPPIEPIEPATAAPLFELEVLASARAFVIGAPSVLAGGQLGLRWDWLAASLSLEGGSQTERYATVDVLCATIVIGAVPLVARGGALHASLGLFAEGGIVVTSASSRVGGFTGTTEPSPLLGAFVRLAGGLRIDPSVALVAAMDVGYHYGVEVVALGENVLSVNGLSLAVRVGIAVAP